MSGVKQVPMRELWFDVVMMRDGWQVQCCDCEAIALRASEATPHTQPLFLGRMVVMLRTVEHLMTRVRDHARKHHGWRGEIDIALTAVVNNDLAHASRQARAFQLKEKPDAGTDNRKRVPRRSRSKTS